jgi:hypothetical protein
MEAPRKPNSFNDGEWTRRRGAGLLLMLVVTHVHMLLWDIHHAQHAWSARPQKAHNENGGNGKEDDSEDGGVVPRERFTDAGVGASLAQSGCLAVRCPCLRGLVDAS